MVLLQADKKLVQGDQILVPGERTFIRDDDGRGAVRIADLAGHRSGQMDADAARLVEGKGEQDERGEQEEDHVDERDDLNARSFYSTGACSTTTTVHTVSV